VPRGEVGELVLTTLGRVGSPLLRYRTGDLVRASQAGTCICGRSELALDGGILGRADDMVVVRGVNVYPTAVEDILRSFGGVADYRVHVSADKSLVELKIQVEPAGGAGPDLAHQIESELKNAFALRIPVSLVPEGSLPRFEMKAKRWIWA
ncbi:MAG: hypothetical protein SFV51_26625, partial [Bryobacteraceae bacterium]|nr:hypothetical protein [Bryobacteraceae bacterium]